MKIFILSLLVIIIIILAFIALMIYGIGEEIAKRK
tara:strand:- start:108 stop:212 length:105 start_codon:yes stop_codon:yes gene_type:complete